MSIHKELVTWNSAYQAFTQQNYQESLELYQEISHLSKISFNIGSIYIFLNEYHKALEYFTSSINVDEYLLISLFQRGNCYFTLGQIELAAKDYSRVLEALKDNMDYTQLGIEYELYSTEVLFNRALCYMGLGMTDKSLEDLENAKKCADEIHLQALQEYGWESRIFMVKGGLQFQIPKYKLQSSKKWLKNAESVTQDSSFLGFLGSTVVAPVNVFDLGKSIVRNVSGKEVPVPPPRVVSAVLSGLPSEEYRKPVPPRRSVMYSWSPTKRFDVSASIKALPALTSDPVSVSTTTSTSGTITSPAALQSKDDGAKVLYIARFLDNSGSIPVNDSIGIFQKRVDAIEACKEFITSALGELETNDIDWIKGWIKGDYCVSVSEQLLR